RGKLMKQTQFFVFFAVVFAIVMAFLWLPQPEPTIVAYAQDDDALAAVPVEEAPTLDGVSDEALWTDAPQIEIPVRRGANMGETTVVIKSVYAEDMVYFLVTWEDPTESFIRSPWE